MIKNKRDFNVYQMFKKIENNEYKRELNNIDPFAVMKTKDSDFENNVKVQKFEAAEESLVKDIGDGIIQRYIRSRGKNRDLDK